MGDIRAPQRAYSLKQGYVNHIIASLAPGSKKDPQEYGLIIPSLKISGVQTVEKYAIAKISFFYNLDTAEIMARQALNLNTKAKNFLASLSHAILLDKKGAATSNDLEIIEFEKADIEIKTVCLEENNRMKEPNSLPAFKYKELMNEDWEDSPFREKLEKKFLFVFFQRRGNARILKLAKFWNMPQKDIAEAKKVWDETKKLVEAGKIIKEIKINSPGKEICHTYFPRRSQTLCRM